MAPRGVKSPFVILHGAPDGGGSQSLRRRRPNDYPSRLRDQIDPTIAAISTMMALATSVLFAASQYFGRANRD